MIKSILIFALTSSLLPAQDGPSHMIITYRAYPDKRATLKPALSSYSNRLSHWRDQGAMGPFQILASALTDDEGWDAMVLARTGTRGMELFKRFEAPDNTSIFSTTTVPVDLVDRGGDGDQVENSGVFLVIPYDCGPSITQQRGFLKPGLVDSLKENGLLGYRFFVPRFPAGRSWNGLLVLHFADWLLAGRKNLPTFQAPVGDCRERVNVLAEALSSR